MTEQSYVEGSFACKNCGASITFSGNETDATVISCKACGTAIGPYGGFKKIVEAEALKLQKEAIADFKKSLRATGRRLGR